MTVNLTAEALVWQKIAREVAEKYVRPKAAECDRKAVYNFEGMAAAGEAGLLSVWIPKEYGGAGAGILSLAVVVEELARADSGFGVAFAVNALGSFPLLVGGTEEQKQRYLPRIAKGKALISFALSEKNAGSDAQSLRVRAIEDGDSYVIHGEKKWNTGGPVSDLFTVFAVTDPSSKSRRISAFLVEKGTPGLEIGKVEPAMGIRTIPVSETHFKGVRVPKTQLLGGVPGLGFAHAMKTLDWARPGVASQAVGAAQGALDYALVYANRRQAFGAPISSFQMVQKMLADMAMKTESARWLVYAAASAVDRQDPALTKMSAMAKCYACDIAVEVATDAVQVFGGYGFMEDYPVAKFYRDAKILQIYEGTNQIQRLVIARNLIKEVAGLGHLDAYIPKEVQRDHLPAAEGRVPQGTPGA